MNKDKFQKLKSLMAELEMDTFDFHQRIKKINDSISDLILNCDHKFPSGESALSSIMSYYYCDICKDKVNE